MQREDDYEIRRKHLSDLDDKELSQRFWSLAQQVVEPLLDLAKKNTSPSIERSVLMRMGFTSLEAKGIVERCVEHQLLGKGAGHIVWRLAQCKQMEIPQAGYALAEGKYWEEIKQYFREEKLSG
ncbi:MAG TPA: ornithine aminomutase subunit alpha [Candidatus Deferrimicrobium sp.]|nr:ornithine aminomutase subunit alpha [Candidatus Deferrimicrobium sp.]